MSAGNFMPLRPGQQKQTRNKITLLDIWDEYTANILLDTNDKISNIKSELPDWVLQNDKFYNRSHSLKCDRSSNT